MDNYNRNYSAYEQERSVESVFPAVMQKVFLWMTLALTITGMTAYLTAGSETIIYAIASNPVLTWGLILAELGLVLWLSAGINKMNATTATLLFIVYSIINGVTMSFIFLVYEIGTIATTFFVTAGTFAVMAVFGMVTKTDLTGMGKLLIMALIGLVIATVVNIFMHSSTIEMICSYAGVLIFTGLTAYDTQKIKQMMIGADPQNDTVQKYAVLGALSLYLDFINLFLYLLRIFGGRRN